MSDEIDSIESTKVHKTDLGDDPSNKSIEQLINLIRMERTNSLRHQKIEELKKLTEGQSQVSFANNLRRILTLGAQSDGSFAMTPELQAQLEKAMEAEDNDLFDMLYGLGLRFDVDFDQANFDLFLNALDSEGNSSIKTKLQDAGLVKGKKPTDKQMKNFIDILNADDNDELRYLLKDNNLLKNKDKLSKAEKENIVESIRLFVDQKHSMNDMSIQTLIRLESEMDQTYQYLMSVIKTFSDTLRTIARNVRGN